MLKNILEQFLSSDAFRQGVISSTKALWNDGSSYSVELLNDSYTVLWTTKIGDKHRSEGTIVVLPFLECDPEEKERYIEDGAGSEEDYLEELFAEQEADLKQEVRESL